MTLVPFPHGIHGGAGLPRARPKALSTFIPEELRYEYNTLLQRFQGGQSVGLGARLCDQLRALEEAELSKAYDDENEVS